MGENIFILYKYRLKNIRKFWKHFFKIEEHFSIGKIYHGTNLSRWKLKKNKIK